MARATAPRIVDLDWHEQQEIEAVLQRFADLSSRAQIEALSLMREYIDGDIKETQLDYEITRRKAALDALRKVAADLGLPDGQPPTTTQFREGAKHLGLDWSVSKVERAWGRWRFACEAYAGHRLRRTARQQGVLDAHTGKRRVYEDYVTCVRLWLETHPPAETIKAYDKWAQEFNEVLPRNQKPVCSWGTIYTALRIGFHDALRVARGEVALVEVPKRHGDHTTEQGPLATRHWIAGEYGLSPHQAVNVPRSPKFPKPVVILSGRRLWLKDDVRAYFANKPFPKRQEFELQDEYLGLAELAAQMGKRHPKQISQTTRIPKPTGLAGKTRYWRRDEVERWLDNERGKENRAVGGRSDLALANATSAAALSSAVSCDTERP